MDADLAQKAVNYALTGAWEEAIKVNKELLKNIPDDTETLNRLARAYFESGNIKKAKGMANKVLKNDPFNPIAAKCVAKWKSLASVKKAHGVRSQAFDFIEEPGKTKLVSLLNLGDKKVIGKLNAGDEILITPHAHRVCVITLDGKYIGRLPDDLAARIRLLTQAGNSYQVFIKSLDPDCIKVFIREITKAKRMTKIQSFPPEVVRNLEAQKETSPEF